MTRLSETLRVMAIVQDIKRYLVGLGPRNVAVRTALSIDARLHGFTVDFHDSVIRIRRTNREMLLSHDEFVQVPIMMECFELFFSTIRPRVSGEIQILDFSRPGLHEYKASATSFYFPSIPEDDVMDAYLNWYPPKPGDVIWDAGAHAGATTYFLSQAVGPNGKVYAFEPDESNYNYLLRNIALHNLCNVIPVKKALAGKTGRAAFQMDGTMSAGIRDFLVYSGLTEPKSVETITIADACQEFGCCPAFIKMDIEGAEVSAVIGSGEFLQKNPVQFAIESYHRVDGEFTYRALERFFPTIGYEVASSDKFGQMFTWAKVPSC